MIDLPKFRLYGEDDSHIENELQPALTFRKWGELSTTDKQIALRELENNGWLDEYSSEILSTVTYLNHEYLRQCPGKHLHAIKPESDYHGYGNESERKKAALIDFQHIFLTEMSDAMVLRMLSHLAACYIQHHYFGYARTATDEAKRKQDIDNGYEKLDRFANCLNHVFQQFGVNQMLTRSGFVPRQDDCIAEQIYEPTLKILSDPKWRTVSDELSKMFVDYREENFPEVITKGHSAVQRFLQILVGEEGKNGRGEIGKLFRQAKDTGLLPQNRFVEPVIDAIQGFITSERATNSTAKPALKEATASDALLMMNVVMVLIQHCLQNIK